MLIFILITASAGPSSPPVFPRARSASTYSYRYSLLPLMLALPSPRNCRLTHKGCAIFILLRFNEQQQPKTTFYIFDGTDQKQALVHGFYHDLGEQPQVEGLLKSWVDAYRHTAVKIADV